MAATRLLHFATGERHDSSLAAGPRRKPRYFPAPTMFTRLQLGMLTTSQSRMTEMTCIVHELASGTITEKDRDALRQVGFSDRDIWDIAAVAGFFNMTNRIASATDMRPNDAYHAQAR